MSTQTKEMSIPVKGSVEVSGYAKLAFGTDLTSLVAETYQKKIPKKFADKVLGQKLGKMSAKEIAIELKDAKVSLSRGAELLEMLPDRVRREVELGETIPIADKLRFADDADDMDDFPLREGLSWRARRDAEVLRSIGRGTMFIGGPRGGGKDLFGTVVDYMNKYYFGRPILLDFLPKKAFGEYNLFDARVMMQEINKMAKAGGVEGITETKDQKEYDEFIEEAVADWALEGEGHILLRNAVIHLSELKRYCYKRNPHNRFNKFVGSLNTVVRHLDALIIGTHVHANEIDEFTFMQYANIRANCEWCVSEPDTTKVKISLRGIIGADFAYGSNILLKPFYYYVNGREPRSFLEGEGFYKLYKTKSMVNLKPVLRKEM